MKVLLDTDVLVDHLRSADSPWSSLLDSIQRRRSTGYISVVTVAELHAGKLMSQPGVRAGTVRFLELFRRVPIQESIAVRAGTLLREHGEDGLALADALIAATALALRVPLLTRNRKHFERVRGLLFHPKS
ncbi:MAG: PIN domain-containing protein [Candidatus Riflebacteria bacterium]|nr:PIN domain-containing protein [Candidatus Riflebacteria bacterium]